MSTMTISPTYAARPARASRANHDGVGPVRLTRRGRLVVLALALGVLLAVGLAFSGGSIAMGESGPGVEPEVVQVAPGQTLWGIASERAEAGEVRELMAEIKRLNALESSVLYAGQELHLPVAD